MANRDEWIQLSATRDEIVRSNIFVKLEDGDGWKSKPEIPTAKEILLLQKEAEGLPENDVRQPWKSKEDYLKAQYEILRREGTEGLRFAVNNYIYNNNHGLRQDDDQHMFVYTQVRIKSYIMTTLGPLARVEFMPQRAIKWLKSGRLKPGSLLALTTKADKFKTICKVAVVAQRPYLLGLDQTPPLVDLMWGNPEDAVFDCDLELVMIEAQHGYFESSRHSLVGLQLAAQADTPIDKYITGSHRGNETPSFIYQSPIMDFSSVVRQPLADLEKLKSLREFNVLSGLLPKDVESISFLDASQLSALHRMVSKELAIIQGPPGTGKTFTSVEAIKVMLASRRKCPGHNPPLIVAAQTNHALDQLLGHCLEANAKILRLGSRSEREDMRPYSLYEMRRKCSRGGGGKRFRELEDDRHTNIDRVEALVDSVFGDSLIDPRQLHAHGIITEAQLESLYDDEMETSPELEKLGPFSLWLGDSRIPARIVRDRQPLISETLEADEDFDYERDVENIAYDEEDADRINGKEIKLMHIWTGKEPGHFKSWNHRAQRLLRENDNLFDIPQDWRGAVYQHLQSKLVQATTPTLAGLLAKYVEICKRRRALKARQDIDMAFSQDIAVIGCTTTGLTKYRAFLAGLQPNTLLIEEAAETREGNITSALYPSLQQLVLVGDHAQMSPRCDIRWLGQHPYNLNVSLFERLINLKMNHIMLNQQRRMRPELRRIVSPFYNNLLDHPSVQSPQARPDVPGMGGRNCWFFDHEWIERTTSDNSKLNDQEAEMITLFFVYLVSNGVSSEKITILTYYRGQRSLLLRRLKGHPSLTGCYFNVFTVDSYQGEENDIVLLSLVRSPDPVYGRNIGFLDNPHRAVVAISRARQGFYIFGNVNNLLEAKTESSFLWGLIFNRFADQGMVNRELGLPLVCQNHGNEIWIKELEDWADNTAAHVFKSFLNVGILVTAFAVKDVSTTGKTIESLLLQHGAHDFGHEEPVKRKSIVSTGSTGRGLYSHFGELPLRPIGDNWKNAEAVIQQQDRKLDKELAERNEKWLSQTHHVQDQWMPTGVTASGTRIRAGPIITQTLQLLSDLPAMTTTAAVTAGSGSHLRTGSGAGPIFAPTLNQFPNTAPIAQPELLIQLEQDDYAVSASNLKQTIGDLENDGEENWLIDFGEPE
ncbi:suppressor of ascus dominance 3 [Neurospora crassa]|uniref:Suppressor of ascus dominance-3 protein n=2 Tax=Neurospora crassa TaxID=5141 RepID=Q7S3A3_NEUCR|nr:suppressor of ascus dominance-3 protein [Neurospora crassa OR74A]EAA29919.2 suppressor of ascus dominance-3 protein [Neurospora crassa OR74A]KHE88414.1 suppressor of ascus dominance 3 [Neurospora crassa]DAA34977.1 TPA_inf: suppressor of ascus dominance 3 [Neurospora crassa]|eukprot:XP_959155.2 suppressor of ascus dominance-3 protein [Neurospora crassa OR74A]